MEIVITYVFTLCCETYKLVLVQLVIIRSHVISWMESICVQIKRLHDLNINSSGSGMSQKVC